MVEAFYSTLKVELVHRYVWATRAQARQAIFDFIEVCGFRGNPITDSDPIRSPIPGFSITPPEEAC